MRVWTVASAIPDHAISHSSRIVSLLSWRLVREGPLLWLDVTIVCGEPLAGAFLRVLIDARQAHSLLCILHAVNTTSTTAGPSGILSGIRTASSWLLGRPRRSRPRRVDGRLKLQDLAGGRHLVFRHARGSCRGKVRAYRYLSRRRNCLVTRNASNGRLW